MATAQGLASFQIVDAVGVTTSCDVPFTYNDATTTLAQIVTWLQGLGLAIDAVTEGKVTKIRFILSVTLPGGLKSAAVANSDVEETALISMDAANTAYNYGFDIPAFVQSKFTGGAVDLADTAVATLLSYLTTATNGIVGSDRYSNALVVALRGNKTFRKKRRALRRA